jgi:hypothetical protein
MDRGRHGLWKLALAGWFVFAFAGCSEKVSGVGGESHFVCETDDDCDADSVCVHDGSSTRGECRPIRGAGGSGGSGLVASPQGAVTFKISPTAGRVCSHTNGQLSAPINVAGVIQALACDLNEGCKPDEFVVVDGDRGTSVACQVRSSGGSFDVSLSLALDGTPTGSESIQFQANGVLSPTGGMMAVTETNTVSAGGGKDDSCSVTVTPNSGRLEAGTVWANFLCENFRDPVDLGETGCTVDGVFLFENCSH